MLEPPTAAATGPAMYRRTASSADSAYGHGEPALGHSADPRRVAETRTRRLERTVSRYLPDRRTRPTQTWRTFLVDHLIAARSPSIVTSSNESGGDEGVDRREVPLLTSRGMRHHSAGGCRLVTTVEAHHSAGTRRKSYGVRSVPSRRAAVRSSESGTVSNANGACL